MQAVYQQQNGGGFVPELVEYRLMSEFGWTPRQIDRADMPRVLRAMQAHAYQDVLAQAEKSLSEMSADDSALLGRVLRAQLPEGALNDDR